tara:strand:+ start:518 stop:1258 length:741 start_codon:yes stop_codon:yes gene_type:complete
MIREKILFQNENNHLWDLMHNNTSLDRYPCEYLVKFINFINQKSNNNDLCSLDIGFGDIANLKMCQEIGYQAFGIEVSDVAVKKAIEKFKTFESSPKLSLFSPPKLPFENEKFNLIYSLQAIYYNIEFEKMISEIYRVMKPGGALFLTFFSPKHWYFNHSSFLSKDIVVWDETHPTKGLRGLKLRYFNSKKTLGNLFSKFKNIRIDDFYTNMLGIEFDLWILSGFKHSDDLSTFDMFKHYQNIEKS